MSHTLGPKTKRFNSQTLKRNPVVGHREQFLLPYPDQFSRYQSHGLALQIPKKLQIQTLICERAMIHLHFVAAFLCNNQTINGECLAGDSCPNIRVTLKRIERNAITKLVAPHGGAKDPRSFGGLKINGIGFALTFGLGCGPCNVEPATMRMNRYFYMARLQISVPGNRSLSLVCPEKSFDGRIPGKCRDGVCQASEQGEKEYRIQQPGGKSAFTNNQTSPAGSLVSDQNRPQEQREGKSMMAQHAVGREHFLCPSRDFVKFGFRRFPTEARQI